VYLPFMEGPRELGVDAFRWRLGVRPLDLDDWIELGDGAEELIAEKARICADHHDTVFVALDDVRDEAQEVADAIVEHLGRRFPERSPAVLDADLHPLDAAARLVPEDLILLIERDGRRVFGAGSVCFPNRWDLRSKLGRTMPEVHAPVDRLNDHLAEPIERFFDRLTPERGFWRLGWGVIDTADAYTPTDGTGAPRPVQPTPDQLYLRVERETIRRFPRTGVILFTIRTFVRPIPAVVAGEPSVAQRLAASIDGLPDDVRDYKDLAGVADDLTTFLRAAVDNSERLDMV
jgi:hypothetical protein